VVARPPVNSSGLVIAPMSLDDLPAVQAIERASFSTPWPSHAYRSELETNRLASYLVARIDGQVVAYGGIWLMVDEAHITTFAVHPGWRRRSIGGRLLLAMLDLARERRAREATLEVRLSNLPARRLYERYGFRPVGLRPGYYSDNHEDALVMTSEPLDDPRLLERLNRLRLGHEANPEIEGGDEALGDEALGDGALGDGAFGDAALGKAVAESRSKADSDAGGAPTPGTRTAGS
jgi:[ribosomal protein S18]-alanine N-acetyltransferase